MNQTIGATQGTTSFGQHASSPWTWLALVVGLLALAGSLYLSLGMQLKPCPLCYYQRTFVMAVVGLLLIGLLTRSGRSSPLSLLALPAATAGLGVAIYHEYLESADKLECPAGVFDIGTAPQQSLVVLLALFVILLLDVMRYRRAKVVARLSIILAVLFGVALNVGAVLSVPPPSRPREPYKSSPDICRPPFHPQVTSPEEAGLG